MVKFGILGCGMIASVHADAISCIPSALLVGVADNNFSVAQSLANKLNVKAYRDYDEMLADASVDAVCICTPSFFHTQNAIKALESGKHVVVEKPMALTSKEADELIAVVDKTGKRLTVISQLRFSDDLSKVKELITERAFGKISLCTLNMKYYRAPEYFSSSPWKGTKKFDGGGALMNQGIHGIDVLEYLLGSIKDVSGKVKTLVHDIEVEDTAVAMLEFECGALGTIVGSTCAYPGFERKIELHGDKGYVVLEENKIAKLMIDGVEQGIIAQTKIQTASDPTKVQPDEHKKQLENFIKAILGEAELLVDCREGRKAVNTIEKIYASSQNE